MSVTRRIAFGALASWFSRGVTIVLGLALMPVLFRHLPKEELGVWLLLGQSWAAMGILDLGFGVTLTRRIALAKGKSGGDPNASLTPETKQEIADLVACGRRIYRIMAGGVFVVSWMLGFFYLRTLELHGLSHNTVWIAWTVLCACQALTVWATVWTCLLQGVGYVGWDALFTSFVNAATLTAQIIAVLCGGSLVALAAVATAGALLQRWLIRWMASRRRPELFALPGKWNPEVLKGMRGLALRAWLTAVAGILVSNTDSFFIASAQGAQDIPAFRAAFLVVLNLHFLAAVFASSSIVFISHLWQAGQIAEVQRIVQRNLRLGLCIMLCGGAAILASGASLFNVWLGPSNYVGFGIVALFVVMFVLEQQTYIISTSCRATEHEAFAGWMMAGGLLKLLLAFVLMKRFGLIGLAAGTLIAQLLTAHWFVLYRGLHRLQFGFNRFLLSVLVPCLIVFAAATLLSFLTVVFVHSSPDWVRLGGASAAAGLVLIAAMWLFILDRHQRNRASAWISLRLSFNPPSSK
jgi:O-antigen/teichoic acid export membrane protein